MVKTFSLHILLLLLAFTARTQKVYHLTRQPAVKLDMSSQLTPPVPSEYTMYDTDVEVEKRWKTPKNQELPVPKVVSFLTDTIRGAQLPPRAKTAISWQAIPFQATEMKRTPAFLFKDIARQNIRYLDKAHGFFSNAITAVEEDSTGVMWIGSAESGLCKLTGHEMTQVGEPSGLPSATVNDLFIDDHHRLWIATTSGLCFLYQDSLYTTGIPALSHMPVNAVSQDRFGALWFSTADSGAFRYHSDSIERFDVRTGLPGNTVNVTLTDRAGNIWFGLNEAGLCRYDGHDFVHYTLSQVVDRNSVKTLFEDEEGLWIGAFETPLMRYQHNSFLTYDLFDGAHPTIYAITEDQHGLWLATYGKGVVNLQGGRLHFYSGESGLTSDHAYDLKADSYGNLWIADLINGISRLGPQLFETNDVKSGIPLRNAQSIRPGLPGDTWYCPNGGYLVKETADAFYRYSNDHAGSAYPLHHAFDCVHLPDGRMFLCTYSAGIIEVLDHRFSYYRFTRGNFVLQCLRAPDDVLWFSTMQHGLKLYKDNTFFDLTAQQGLAGDEISTIACDGDGRLWVGIHNQGMNVIDHDRIATITTGNGLSSNEVNTIYPGGGDGVWIGTTNGVDILHGDYTLHLNTGTGLIANHIRSVIRDSRGAFWIATTDGLSKVEWLNDTTIRVHNYDTDYGPNVTDFNGCAYEAGDGRLYWGTNQHILIYAPQNEPLTTGRLPLVIDRISTANTSIPGSSVKDQRIRIQPGEAVSVKYYAIDWGFEEQISYAYALVAGADTGWIENNDHNEINIQGTDPGEYTLLIKATGHDGRSTISAIDIEWLPRWYESTPFRIFLIIFFIIAGPAIFLAYSLNARRKRTQLEGIVREKTNELIEENMIKDALLQETHHRVKNNLQTITSLVDMQVFTTKNEENKKALIDTQVRISAMALVHEMLYSSKTIGMISSRQYIHELVSSINEMSNTRMLPVRFNLDITDHQLGMTTCISLGLLTSEVISNSIKYAFEGISDPAITVRFAIEGDKVIYMISDNGNGFDVASRENEHTLGIRLMDIFARQLSSELSIVADQGITVTLIIPKDKITERKG